jgi:hypothetical protein
MDFLRLSRLGLPERLADPGHEVRAFTVARRPRDHRSNWEAIHV